MHLADLHLLSFEPKYFTSDHTSIFIVIANCLVFWNVPSNVLYPVLCSILITCLSRLNVPDFINPVISSCRFQWPRGLRHDVSSLSRTLESFSNPTQDMDVCVHLFCVCIALCVGSGLAKGSSPAQGVLPTVCAIKKLKKRPRFKKGL
jgi:hypothetical protein